MSKLTVWMAGWLGALAVVNILEALGVEDKTPSVLSVTLITALAVLYHFLMWYEKDEK